MKPAADVDLPVGRKHVHRRQSPPLLPARCRHVGSALSSDPSHHNPNINRPLLTLGGPTLALT